MGERARGCLNGALEGRQDQSTKNRSRHREVAMWHVKSRGLIFIRKLLWERNVQ